MRAIQLVLLTGIFLATGLFTAKAQVLLNMVALEETPQLKSADLARVLNADWGMNLIADSIILSDKAGAFEAEGEMIGLMIMNEPIPWSDLEGPCNYASLWADATVKMKAHKAHIIPVILTTKKPVLERYKLLTKITCAILKLTKPVGVFHSAHELVISPEVYLSGGDQIKEGNLPLANWLFIGVTSPQGKSSGFTIGLETFGYKELEVVKSTHTSKEVFTFLFDVANYVIGKEVTFKSGETVGFTAGEKIPVKLAGSVIRKKAKVFLLAY